MLRSLQQAEGATKFAQLAPLQPKSAMSCQPPAAGHCISACMHVAVLLIKPIHATALSALMVQHDKSLNALNAAGWAGVCLQTEPSQSSTPAQWHCSASHLRASTRSRIEAIAPAERTITCTAWSLPASGQSSARTCHAVRCLAGICASGPAPSPSLIHALEHC